MLGKPVFLIGMPGAGKSTLGVLLAKQQACSFIDTDLLIQRRGRMGLQKYLDQNGFQALRALEERVLTEESFGDSVVATGGSVVYSDAGMARIRSLGLCIYLHISLETMLQRVTNQADRGIACASGISLEELYQERLPLYEHYADRTIVVDRLNFDQALSDIINAL